MGNPCTFTLAITNGGGAAVNIYSIQPQIKRPDGQLHTGHKVGVVAVSPQLAAANTGANQFNVPVNASATVYFTFDVVFYGPVITGGPTQPSMAYVVDCLCSYSDGTSSGCLSPIQGSVNSPQFGTAGSPPDPVPLVGQLNFSTPLNTGLLF